METGGQHGTFWKPEAIWGDWRVGQEAENPEEVAKGQITGSLNSWYFRSLDFIPEVSCFSFLSPVNHLLDAIIPKDP